MNKKINKDMNKPNGRTINSKSNKTLRSDFTASNKSAINTSRPSDKYYKCYSVKLKEFLNSNNLKIIKETRHPKTNKIAFIYEKNKQLDDLLTVWTNNKDKNIINDTQSK